MVLDACSELLNKLAVVALVLVFVVVAAVAYTQTITCKQTLRGSQNRCKNTKCLFDHPEDELEDEVPEDEEVPEPPETFYRPILGVSISVIVCDDFLSFLEL